MSHSLQTLPHVPTREQIEALQREVSKLPQAEPITRHYFADGMYLREVFREKGTLVVGKVHKKEHFFMLIEGELTLWTEAGMKTVKAPFLWVSQPGTKRVTYAHVDSTAVTVHRVSSRDVEELERELVEEDPATLFGPGNVPKFPSIECEL
jgi:quercetin dioxygenase-like cupin family protein